MNDKSSEGWKTLGVPKSLDRAIYTAMCVGPLNQLRDRAYHVLREFLNYHFEAAIQADPQSAETLKKLFDSIVERENFTP